MSMKFRNIAVGVVVGGVIFAGGVAAVAWQKGFYLASAVGIKNVAVVIAPYDMRKGRKPELERSPLKWYPNLCNEIHTALSGKF